MKAVSETAPIIARTARTTTISRCDRTRTPGAPIPAAVDSIE
jgi:hypothetical protein